MGKDLGVAADPALIEAVSRSDREDQIVHDLGAMPPPTRGCLAEFFVEGSRALPYVEDEMASPSTKKHFEEDVSPAGPHSRSNSSSADDACGPQNQRVLCCDAQWTGGNSAHRV